MIDQIFKAVADAWTSGPAMHLGPEWEPENDSPPTIVWIPENVELRPGQDAVGRAANQPRSIATAAMRVRHRLWAHWNSGTTAFPTGYDQSMSDYAALWELLRSFLVQLRTLAPGAYELTTAAYLTDESNPRTEYGKALDLVLTWSMPIAADPYQLVTITSPANLTMEGTMDLATDVIGVPSP